MTKVKDQSLNRSAEEHIRQLAKEHNITCHRTALDDWADKIAELSDAYVELDEVSQLLVALEREDIISGEEAIDLHIDYLRDKSFRNAL